MKKKNNQKNKLNDIVKSLNGRKKFRIIISKRIRPLSFKTIINSS